MDYLPFFSGCRGFDSHIYFYYLTEVAWTEIEEFVNYGFCNLVPVNETIFIDQWAPRVFTPVADECEVEIRCTYEERFKEAAASTRWFEVEGDTLFHITQEAEPQSSLFEASVLANDQTEPEVNTGTYEAAVAAQESIPVMFNPAEGVEVVRGIIPTEISIDISYFQFSPLDKRMISAEGEFDGYVNAKKHDGSYLLTVTTAPLNFSICSALRVRGDFLHRPLPRTWARVSHDRGRSLGNGSHIHDAEGSATVQILAVPRLSCLRRPSKVSSSL